MMFFTCFRKYYCVYSPSMYDVVDASKQDDYLHKYRIFFIILLHSIFSESYVLFMFCIQTIYCKGSGETAHMCKLV